MLYKNSELVAWENEMMALAGFVMSGDHEDRLADVLHDLVRARNDRTGWRS